MGILTFVEQVNQLARRGLVTSCCPPHSTGRGTLIASSHPGLQRMLWLKCTTLYPVTHCCDWLGTKGVSSDVGPAARMPGKSPVNWISWLPHLVLWLSRCAEVKAPVSAVLEVTSGCSPGGHLTSQSHSHITEMSERDLGPAGGGWALRTMKVGDSTR